MTTKKTPQIITGIIPEPAVMRAELEKVVRRNYPLATKLQIEEFMRQMGYDA